MPPFEWITPDRAWGVWGAFGAVCGLILAATSFYLALVSPAGFETFGVSVFVWFGAAQLLSVAGLSYRWFRIRSGDEPPDPE